MALKHLDTVSYLVAANYSKYTPPPPRIKEPENAKVKAFLYLCQTSLYIFEAVINYKMDNKKKTCHVRTLRL